MTPDASSNLIPAVLAYFQGERHEMLSILGVSGVLAAIVVLFFLTVRDSFARGLMVTVLVCAALLSATAITLLVRDQRLSQSLVSALSGATGPTAVEQEQTRITAVIGNYPRYRWGAAVVGLAALLILALSRQPWLHGAAAGMLLLVVAQVVIDRYSENRATSYLAQLSLRSQ
ncbi:hypothetical protein [Ottowia sp. SB7-C50]|uniref:hypothetical protein n=1 Tax=Ottowia sp. SB7-C50 TaxID=3081231 RepID=UPI002954903D|nr:hypothetical protein [Ottowia sp. SB7-C50]WOP14235.1 hypothetical protein R0D99_10085 [Ottowia sp. SB7-C50]